jgi:hypothetical protein
MLNDVHVRVTVNVTNMFDLSMRSYLKDDKQRTSIIFKNDSIVRARTVHEYNGLFIVQRDVCRRTSIESHTDESYHRTMFVWFEHVYKAN